MLAAMIRKLLGRVTRAARSLARRLTPPGNRSPLDESGEQHSIDANHTPSEAGQREHMTDWMGGP
jgi:hypothetical protein